MIKLEHRNWQRNTLFCYLKKINRRAMSLKAMSFTFENDTRNNIG